MRAIIVKADEVVVNDFVETSQGYIFKVVKVDYIDTTDKIRLQNASGEFFRYAVTDNVIVLR